MANQYETYIKRLRGIKQSRPEMDVYERNNQAMSKPFNIMNEQTARLTQSGGASTAAQIAALDAGRNSWNQQQGANYSEALNATSQREGQVDMKIAEVEAQNAAYKDQQAKIKREKRNQILRTAMQIGGSVLGAALAIPTGGMSLLAGAALGGSIGQTASGFVGIDGNGNLSVQPKDWDMNVAMEGLAQTVTAVANNANEAKTRNMMGLLSQNSGRIFSAIEGMENPESAMFTLQAIMANGSPADLETWINNLAQQPGTPAAAGLTALDQTQVVDSPDMVAPNSPGMMYVSDSWIALPKETDAPPASKQNESYLPTAGGRPVAVQPGTYTVRRGGEFSRGNSGQLVTRVNGQWVSVKDANGNNIPIRVGETVEVNSDGTFQIGGGR